MCLKNLFFVTASLLIFRLAEAQRNYDDYNLLGLQGGYTIFDLNTDDLTTESSGGFHAGFTTRGAFINDFDLVYGISFSSENVKVLGTRFIGSDILEDQLLEYNISGALLNLLGSYNIVKKHLSVELGPILQVSGKMKLKDSEFENYVLDGYNTLLAKDIQDISTINLRLAGGITAGVENFRVMAQYQYGVTNTLNKLNDQELENDEFKGNTSTILLGAVFYF